MRSSGSRELVQLAGAHVSDWPTDQVFGYIAGAAKSFLKTYKRFLSSDRHHIQSERRMFV